MDVDFDKWKCFFDLGVVKRDMDGDNVIVITKPAEFNKWWPMIRGEFCLSHVRTYVVRNIHYSIEQWPCGFCSV